MCDVELAARLVAGLPLKRAEMVTLSRRLARYSTADDPLRHDALVAWLWAHDVKALTQKERTFAEAIADTIESELDDVLRALNSLVVVNEGSVLGALEKVSQDWDDRIERVVRQLILEEVARAGTAAMRAIFEVTSRPVPAFDVLRPSTVDFLTDHGRRIGTKYRRDVQEIMRGVLVDGLQEGDSTASIARRLREKVASLTPARAEAIARTETRFAQMHGQIQGWRQSGVVIGKQWLLAPDACEFCQALADEFGTGQEDSEVPNKTLSLDEHFYSPEEQLVVHVELGDGSMSQRSLDFSYHGPGGVQGPPLHPNCRCDLIPVLHEDYR